MVVVVVVPVFPPVVVVVVFLEGVGRSSAAIAMAESVCTTTKLVDF